jgi:glyoxylase-like metal-dependent hydrolase (beta-lactamase superfamily II)
MFQFEKISDSVWAHTRGDTFGHIAFIKLKDRLVFIDSGYYPKVIKDAREKAEEITGLKVKHLIITHHHGDHILGNQHFEDCEIISAEPIHNILKNYWTEETVQKVKARDPENFSDLKFVFPNQIFVNRYTITDDNLTLEIIQTNGHTEGSSFVFIPEEEILIAGDLLFAEEIPYFGDNTTDPYAWIEAYKQMIQLNPKVVVPGHGPLSDVEELRNQLEYMEKCVEWMEKYIENGGKKENLETIEDFPMIEFEPYDNFEMLFNESKNRTYDVVKMKYKSK